MAAALKLFTQQQLEEAMSVEVVRRCFDDDNDGEGDLGPLARLQEDCAAEVIARLAGIMPSLATMAVAWQADLTTVPLRLRKLAIDVARVEMAIRFPTTVRRNAKELADMVNASFARIRIEGIDSLGLGGVAPEPASNHGGTTWAGGDDQLEENEPFFNGPGALGDFSR